MLLVQDDVYEDTESYAIDLMLDASTTGVFINQSVTEIFILDQNSKQKIAILLVGYLASLMQILSLALWIFLTKLMKMISL